MKDNLFDVIVIGGGPAGMMATGRAGELGAKVLLLEKNERLGKKLSITGGRRCNITNAEVDQRLFLNNFPEAKKFLFSSFSQFGVESTFKFFEDRGLPLVIEERKRAFPKSQSAEDVCRVLENYVQASRNVTVRLQTSFLSFVFEKNILRGVKTTTGSFFAKRIILATGGFAHAETGSTGEGVTQLKTLGHTVKDPDANLTPLCTSATWVHELSGTSIDDMTLRFIQDNKTQIKLRGRLLFTHFGISGPLVLNSAYKVKALLKKGKVSASVDLFPDYDLGSLDAFLINFFAERKNKILKTVLKELLQKKLSEAVLDVMQLPIADVPVNSITKDERKLLGRTLKNLHFPITGTMGLEWSIVADGGVDPKEVDFKNMSSRLHPNLYLIGDALNINRPSGGFSLQLCWTTGWIAGTHASKKHS